MFDFIGRVFRAVKQSIRRHSGAIAITTGVAFGVAIGGWFAAPLIVSVLGAIGVVVAVETIAGVAGSVALPAGIITVIEGIISIAKSDNDSVVEKLESQVALLKAREQEGVFAEQNKQIANSLEETKAFKQEISTLSRTIDEMKKEKTEKESEQNAYMLNDETKRSLLAEQISECKDEIYSLNNKMRFFAQVAPSAGRGEEGNNDEARAGNANGRGAKLRRGTRR